VIPGYHRAEVPRGSQVTVRLKNGRRLEGTYQGPLERADGEADSRYIIIKTAEGKNPVALSSVGSITYEESSGASGVLVGALVGLAIDTAIVVGVTSAMRDSNSSNRPLMGNESGNFSCPLVYSFDGNTYHLDGEVFGGALFPSAQRSDLARLDHLKEHRGFYQLEVTGQPGETQHVDWLALLVVDHPAESEVAPTRLGGLQVLRNPTAPVWARDAGGADIIQELAEADGHQWWSHPFNRDGDEVRDYVEMEFFRPPEAREATLALRVQNTLWGSELQALLLTVPGSGLEQWYRLLDTSPEARAAVHQAFVREGMQLVKVWRDGERQTVDHVWEVGPAIAREVAVPLDLSSCPGDRLLVRLESTEGLWRIDRARADFEVGQRSAGETRRIELSPLNAVGVDGTDRRAELLAEDGRHYDMPPGERARLDFRAPPRPPDTERTLLVRAAGWYRIHVDAKGPGDSELMQRLVAVPGAYGRMARRHLQERLRGWIR
jgi:hypothetical protein